MALSWPFIAVALSAGFTLPDAAAQTANDANATPKLRVLGQVNAVDGVVLYRAGQLFVGRLDMPGQPAIHLLAEPKHTQMPAELDAFQRLEGACFEPDAPETLKIHGDLQGDGRFETVQIGRPHPLKAAQVRVLRDDQPLASARLPFAAVPCFAAVLEVDSDDRPELVVLWLSDESETAVIGVHVYQLPTD